MVTRVGVLDLIREDHRRLTGLLQEIDSGLAGPAAGTEETFLERVLELERALLAHDHAERASVYPFLETRRDTKGIAKDYIGDHEKMAHLMEDVVRLADRGNGWEKEFWRLWDVVTAHVEDEEEELFPDLRSFCSAVELDDLAEEFEAARSRFLREFRASGSGLKI